MKVLKLLSLALLLGAAAFAGGESRVKGGIEIKVGKERKVEGADMKIAFDSVSEDSRCPVGAECIWQGNARVRLVVTTSKGECSEFDLNTTTQPTEHKFGDYTIRLAALTPQPSVNGGLPKPSDYVATVVVETLKKK